MTQCASREALWVQARLLAAVAELRFGNFPGLAFDIRAGQVVQQHFIFGSKEILPALLQMREQRWTMFQQTIEHEVKLILAAPMKIRPEQIAHRALVIPLAMTTPFAARRDEPVGDGDLKQLGPVGAFARGRQFIRPELIQAQLPPEIARKPAGAVLAGTTQMIIAQAQ